ncbi:putative uncharacterized oxidoreductase [Halotydeus destructor]|nr:putative uncharacterized oxidoreductase [Halotydeus destructor]
MASDAPLVLVTGVSGYIGSCIVKQLLEDGTYRVRGTVRSLENEAKIKLIKDIVPDAKYPIELVEADLLKEDTWPAAVKDVTYVLHVASPFPDTVPSNPDDLIKPAVEGTLAVLKAASGAATVKRVVLTSSCAAVYDASVPIPKENEETKKFSEENWTNADDPLLEPYAKSKTLAEKAAWDFVKELADDKKLDLVVINPGWVLGPLINKHTATSHSVVKKLLDRSAPAIAKMVVAVADIRDVVAAHIKALTCAEAVGKRHLIVTQNLWLKDVAAILKKEFQPKGYSVPSIVVPNVFVWLNSLVEKQYKPVVSRLSRDYTYDNTRMKEVLGITPTEVEKTIIDSATSLIDLEIISQKKKKTKKCKGKKEETEVAVNGDAAEEVKENGDGDKTETVDAKKELEPEDKEKPVVAAPAEAPVEIAAN